MFLFLLFFIVLQVADGFVTYHGIKIGMIIESNPLMIPVINQLGLGLGLFIGKFVAISAGVFFYWAMNYKQKYSKYRQVFIFLVGVYTGNVIPPFLMVLQWGYLWANK